jgi:Glucose-6-phosphate dehydrogenase subunit N-terminal domain/Glucose-6-phosphate dehydrogenase subunit C-terminal domain
VETLGSWHGENVSIGEIERRLAELRHSTEGDGAHQLRTSVMTHIAWVPPEWEQAAQGTRVGLGGRHPSRAIVLYPDPKAGSDCVDARVVVEAYGLPGLERHVSAEVIEVWLRGKRCVDPASIVAPLLMPDLPVFLRWRGRPPFSGDAFERLLDGVDRLITYSSEWPDVPRAYDDLAQCFDRAACSDIAWRRTDRWRGQLAGLWPEIAEVKRLTVVGPAAEAYLLTGWLRSRLDTDVELQHEEAESLERIDADGTAVPEPLGVEPTPSDLLSAELDVLERDRIYEAAAVAAGDLAPIAA